MREAHTRPHFTQVKATFGQLAVLLFRSFLFFIAVRMFFSLKAIAPALIAAFQASRSDASFGHSVLLMPKFENEDFNKSLYLFFGVPTFLRPVESSPYKAILGRR